MQSNIIGILQKALSLKFQGSTLYCKGVIIDNKSIIDALFNNGTIENSIVDGWENGDRVDIELSIVELSKVDIYRDKISFLKKYIYLKPPDSVYIIEDKNFLNGASSFLIALVSIRKLLNSLVEISKFYNEKSGIKNILFVNEEKHALIPLTYSVKDVNCIDDVKSNDINALIEILNDSKLKERYTVYIDCLIDFLIPIPEGIRFSHLVNNFNSFIEQANASYSFYLRSFSYNKLKIELDGKALEFTQKLQGVINDSQSKLIAIPTIFGLALSALNYSEVNSIKNYMTIIGLFIFCIFIQIFINNQKTVLSFIENNITDYKSTFKDWEIIKKNNGFSSLDIESGKQRKRILLIQFLLWSTLFLTISIVLFLNSLKLISIIACCIWILYCLFRLFKTRY